MKDNLGIFDRDGAAGGGDTGGLDLDELRAALARTTAEVADGAPDPPSRTAHRRQARASARRRHHRRVLSSVIAVLVLAVIAAGVVVGVTVWRTQATPVTDWAGNGVSEVVIHIGSGDSLDDIASTMVEAKVVASAGAFVKAGANDADLTGIQPGYYRVRMHSSAAAAIDQVTDPNNRVGQLRIIHGQRLTDVSAHSGSTTTVVPGYISAITKAACVPVNNAKNCFTADELWQVAETADPVTLHMVDWAVAEVRAAPDPRRRLEGMIVPGDYDIAPGSSALQALTAVVGQSSARWNSTDIIADASAASLTPYQVAIIASLVESESNTTDMPKVSVVIRNRLAAKMKLEFDSTVNYALNRAQISTTAADRADPSPYNTYRHQGLPPTPISSPGPAAIDAALNPAVGHWLFFVKVDKDGNSCFSTTLAEHNACVDKARANGVFG